MRHSFLTVAIILALLMGANVYAQDVEMTPYEQKREQLGMQAMEKIMNTMSAYDRALFSVNLMNALKEAHEAGDRFQEMIIGENIIYAFCDIGEGLQTEANLLSRSFDMSDVYAGEAIQEWKEIGQWYKQERLKLDQTKTAEDIRREQDRAEFMGNHPGMRGVKQRVRKDFLKWAKKDQFEKTVTYNERLSKKGISVFDSLCFVHFNEMINSEMNRSLDENYDADREGYGMRFYYSEKGNEAAYIDAFWPITPQQLRIVEKMYWDATYSKGLFEKDGYYFPAIYHLEMSTSGWSTKPQKWDIVLGEPQPVTLAIKDILGDSNIACGFEHIFDYLQYSINLLTRQEFVDKVWSFYEEKDNPYLIKNDSGIGNFPYMAGPMYKKLFPSEKEFFTKGEVDRVFQKLTDDARVNDFIHNLEYNQDGNGGIINTFSREQILDFLDVYDSKQRGEFIARCISEDKYLVSTLSNVTSSHKPDCLSALLCQLKIIDKNSLRYGIDMVPVYSYVIEITPYYAKKYQKGTPEEKVAKFRSKEMSRVDVE